MLFKAAILKGIRSGRIDLAFRRWKRPTVKSGTRLRTAAGVVEIVAIDEVEADAIAPNDAMRAGFPDRAALLGGIERDAPLYRIELRFAGADPRRALSRTEPGGEAETAAVLARLARLDARAGPGRFARRVLSLIAANPGRRAGDLAPQLHLKAPKFKALVRRLKELGLTESLETGYRLSARGKAVLDAMEKRRHA